jgi:hypothetical protein
MCVSEIYCEKSNKDFLFVGERGKRRSEERMFKGRKTAHKIGLCEEIVFD